MRTARQVAIFGSVDGNYSIDRYARELAGAFPTGRDVRVVQPASRPGLVGKVLDKRWRYAALARREQAELNIIVSEAYAFLLNSVDPARTAVVCHDMHPLIEQKHRGLWRSVFRGELRRLNYVATFRRNLRKMAAARRIITVSEHTRKDLLKYCPEVPAEKVVAVHSGLSAFWSRLPDERLRAAHGLAGKRVLLHVGNDNWYKNFSRVLDAFALLAQRPDVVLVKVGDINPANRQELGALGLAERVVHVPRADDAELRSWYSAADVLLFPSLHEGFGWPPLEAMACGCPVVAAARASIPEVCGESVLYADAQDSTSIAAMAARLLDDGDLRRRMIEQGLQHVRSFSWQSTVAGILQAMGEPPGSPAEAAVSSERR